MRRTCDANSIRDKIQCRPIPSDSEFIEGLLANSSYRIRSYLPHRGVRKV